MTFPKSKGVKGFWAAGVQRIEKAATMDDRREQEDTSSTYSDMTPSPRPVPASAPGSTYPSM